MNEDELFACAKLEIFGQVPECSMEKIGRNIAINYLSKLLEEAEAIHLGLRKAENNFATYLQNAFLFSTDPSMEHFPEETKKAAQKCSDNFRARYEPLIEQLQLKAA